MAYSDEAVQAKLSALNETQDSIVTVAQWIMFHRRHADRTAFLWHARLQESPTPAKRLTLIYLANEVVQQSRARSKQDFLLAFEPLISDATSRAYKNASQDIQSKLKRVVEVWKQRQIFDRRIQETTEERLREIDQQRGSRATGGGGRLGGSLFGGGGNVPAELEGVVKSQAAVSRDDASAKPAVNSANADYARLMDPEAPMRTPPVQANMLNKLLDKLATAQGAVEASIKARRELIIGLERLVEKNKSKLSEDETTATDLATRWEGIDAKKRDVEDSIMRGATDSTAPGTSAGELTNGALQNGFEVERPEAEGFTPPPPEVETFTPPAQDMEAPNGDPVSLLGEVSAEPAFTSTTGAEIVHERPPSFDEPAPAFEPPPALDVADSPAAAAEKFLASLGNGLARRASDVIANSPMSSANGNSPNDPRLKRRKMSHRAEKDDEEDGDNMFGADTVAGMDEDAVAAMLGPQ